jgi:hypothetical protein
MSTSAKLIFLCGNWTDVEAWVDEDQAGFTGSERGWLWIHRAA